MLHNSHANNYSLVRSNMSEKKFQLQVVFVTYFVVKKLFSIVWRNVKNSQVPQSCTCDHEPSSLPTKADQQLVLCKTFSSTQKNANKFPKKHLIQIVPQLVQARGSLLDRCLLGLSHKEHLHQSQDADQRNIIIIQ